MIENICGPEYCLRPADFTPPAVNGIEMGYFSDGFHKAINLLLHMDDATFSAITATLVSTSCALGVAMALGLPLGFLLGYTNFPGKKLIRLVSDTLLAFPTVLIGLIVYALITYRGPLGQWGLLFTLPGMVIGQTILALPIIISWTARRSKAWISAAARPSSRWERILPNWPC